MIFGFTFQICRWNLNLNNGYRDEAPTINSLQTKFAQLYQIHLVKYYNDNNNIHQEIF